MFEPELYETLLFLHLQLDIFDQIIVTLYKLDLKILSAFLLNKLI